jgi:DNA mismatch repair protein MSH6
MIIHANSKNDGFSCRNDVTFLYKLMPGVCPKSYGMNVAKMAGVHEAIVQRAEDIAMFFEENSTINQYHSTRHVKKSRNTRFRFVLFEEL